MNPQTLADEMLKRAREEAREIYAEREEIMRAHIAKHGFDVDNTMQVECNENGSRRWHVVHISDNDVAKVRRTLLISRISKQPLTLWQKVCVWMATGKWAK